MNAPPAMMNPFPGLRPFTPEEDYLFFGREEQTIELLERLSGNRFVAVVGTSGSGKSSLVRCGLLSELLGGRMLDAGSSWHIAVTHPGGNPLALLTDALLDADLYDRQREHARENVLATLSRSHFGLVEAVKQADLGEGTNFLLVVDQFEEIFRFQEAGQTQQEAANEFVSLLLEASAQRDVPIYVVLTMRSDFIGECSHFEGLAEMVNRSEFLIPRLTREQYKRVIEGPIKVAGGQITPRLLQRLLNDLGQQADQLPCLQHALMRTWDVWAANKPPLFPVLGEERPGLRGNSSTAQSPSPPTPLPLSTEGEGRPAALDLDDYQRVGKMTQALSLHADEIYESLASDRQRDLCRGMFQALTVEESNGRGIRRPQRLGRLCQILEVSADELRPIIDAYRRSGVTFLMPSPEVELTEQTIIDISHESLMRVWTRLRQWVEEETQAAGIYHRLSESAALNQQGKMGLYRNPELGIALAWRELKRPNAAWADRYRTGFATAMAYLDASQESNAADERAREAARTRELEQAQQLAEARQIQLEQELLAAGKLRKLLVGLGVVALVAVVACIAALVSYKTANDLALLARQKSEIAETSAAAADRERKSALQAEKATADALIVAEAQKAKAQAAERLSRAAEEEGRKLLYTTDMQLVPFIWKDPTATAAQLRARLDTHVPEQNPNQAGKDDLRSFEWRYYQHLLDHSAVVFSGHEVAVVDGAFTSIGQLVTLDQKGQVRRWDLGSQAEDKAGRRDLPDGASAQVRILSPDGRLAALCEGKKVQVFDTVTGEARYSIDSVEANPNRRLLFSQDSKRLVIVDTTRIRWCDADTGKVVADLDRKYDRVESIALSADGLTLTVLGHDSGFHYSNFRLDSAAKKVTPLSGGNNGSPDAFSVCALSPDGQRLVIGEKGRGSLHGVVTAPLKYTTWHGVAHTVPVSAIAYSDDGAKVAAADTVGTIKIWDARKLTSNNTADQPTRIVWKYENEPALLTLKGQQGAITAMHFSRDGKRLVTTGIDKTARVWDLENAGAAIRPLERYGWSLSARFSPDGQTIAATANYRRAIHLWDATTGKLVRVLSADTKSAIARLAFSPTDKRLLAVGQFGQKSSSNVVLWDIDAGTEIARLPGATDPVAALAFSPDGKYLVAGLGFPDSVKVWEVATRRLVHRLGGNRGHCNSLDFSRDGSRLVSGYYGGSATIWSTATWKAVQQLENPDPSPGRDAVFSPDDKIVALANERGNVQLWDAASGKLLETLKGHSSKVTAVAFSPDGRTLVSGSDDRTIRLWNVATRRELMQMDPGNVGVGTVFLLSFSPDGKQLLAGGWNAGIWSTAPILWNDAERAAETMRLLLNSNADFRNRVRMFSENLRLHEALAKLDAKDERVQAALAATEANWHASRQAWPEATQAFDRLVAAEPTEAAAWLRTPGLLRVATALFHQNRPADAALLLRGGAGRRAEDGLSDITRVTGFGFKHAVVDGALRVTEVAAGSPASRTNLLPGDAILKVNGIDLAKATVPKVEKLLKGDSGTKLRLTVRHLGSTKTEDVELVQEEYRVDEATGALIFPLLAALEKRLAEAPGDAGLLELRAELNRQETDFARQVSDFTALIKILAEAPGKFAAARLQRSYCCRGDAYLGLNQWPEALGDYAHVITPETTDVELLSNRARVNEALKNWDSAASDWSRAANRSLEGGKLLGEFAQRLVESGQASLAETTRKKARKWLEEKLAKEPENPTLAAELRQARFSAILRGEEKPVDNAERLSFAKIAYDAKKFAAAATFWAEALANDAKAGDSRQTQHRYNAACAAALAAAGQSTDESPLGDAAKATLRLQALDWLKVELTVWDKLLASGPPQNRTFIVRTLNHWLKDADLTSIRDAAALDKLPLEQQKAFNQLWAEVATLLKKAEANAK